MAAQRGETPAGSIPDQRLSLNQIQPRATPTNTFVRPGREQTAAPAKPIEIPGVTQIKTRGTAGTSGFQTKNGFQRFAEDLAPFNSQLLSLTGELASNYVEGEYQKGLNEAMKAAVLLQGQSEQSAEAYAGDTRKIAQTDMPAALLADSMNPYRRGGLEAGLARQAASLAGTEFRRRYRDNRLDLASEVPGSPKLAQFKAQVQSDLMQTFGLSLDQPAALKYFVPKANQAWEVITEEHWDDHQKVLKEQGPTVLLGEVSTMVTSSYEAGVVRWQNPSTGQVEAASLAENPERFEQLLALNVSEVLDRGARRMGIPGEPTQLVNGVVSKLLEGSQIIGVKEADGEVGGLEGIPSGFNSRSMQRMLSLIEVGPEMNLPGADGQTVKRRQTVGERWDIDAWKDVLSYDAKRLQRKNDAQKIALEAYELEAAEALDQLGAGASQEDINLRLAELDSDERFAGLPLNERLQARNRAMRDVSTAQENSVDPVVAEERLVSLEQLPKRDFNAATALQEEKLWAMQNLPRGERARYLNRVRSLIDEKVGEKGRFDPIVSAQANATTTTLIARSFPNSILEMQKLGITPDITNLRAYNKGGVANATELLQARAKQIASDALLDAEATAAANGKTLSATEKSAAVSKALSEWAASGKPQQVLQNAKAPGASPGTPSGGTPSAAPSSGGTNPGQQPARRTPSYESSQLSQLEPAELKNYKLKRLISSKSLSAELVNALNNKGFSTDLKQAARSAGVTPLEFLKQQLKFYPAIKGDSIIQNLEREGRFAGGRSAAARQTAVARTPDRANWLMALMTPTAQATAVGDFGASGYGSGSYGAGGVGVSGDPGGLAALIRSGEGSYRSVNYGTTGSASTMNLPGMTIGQVERMQANGELGAAGAYQFTKGVLAQARREAKLPPNALMTPENQDKMFWALVTTGNKRPALAKYLKGQSNDLDAAQRELSLEWAAAQGPAGVGQYDGDAAGNRASLPSRKIRQALVNARRQLLASSGVQAPTAALQALTNPKGYQSFQITSQFGSKESFRRHAHEGLDLGIPQGRALGLSVPAKVVKVHRTSSTDREAGGGYGGFVDLRLDNGVILRMAHLSHIPTAIRVGARVMPNQMVARSGGRPGSPGSGRSGGAHLHLEQLSHAMGIEQTARGKTDPIRGGGVRYLRVGD